MLPVLLGTVLIVVAGILLFLIHGLQDEKNTLANKIDDQEQAVANLTRDITTLQLKNQRLSKYEGIIHAEDKAEEILRAAKGTSEKLLRDTEAATSDAKNKAVILVAKANAEYSEINNTVQAILSKSYDDPPAGAIRPSS